MKRQLEGLRRSVAGFFELIAEAGDRLDQLAGFRAELFAQARDVRIHRAGGDVRAIAPDALHELLARDDAPRGFEEDVEQIEFLRPELDLLAADRDGMLVRIKADRT